MRQRTRLHPRGAERIAAKLTAHGLATDTQVLQLRHDPAAYTACVLGNALHRAAWLLHADVHVRRNLAALAQYPLRPFGTGIAHVTGRTSRAGAIEPRRLPHYRQTLTSQDHHLLAGAVGPSHYGPVSRLVFRALDGRYGDYRDWKDIDTWAESIAQHLTTAQGAAPNEPHEDRGAPPGAPG
ncbi:hypothetical protein [Streptomyces sp. S.PB5]|uniref:hypothetical protein n=1 Tax=Streptomyces sp. S.PB5 TaxID=3020844 RepID=UPI0025AFFB4E|nr:hypothetical protein [Streptomyces sp. S.PB5]MDN3028989.1 hypothetical protein [Streptomyces sp. S.PB5]